MAVEALLIFATCPVHTMCISCLSPSSVLLSFRTDAPPYALAPRKYRDARRRTKEPKKLGRDACHVAVAVWGGEPCVMNADGGVAEHGGRGRCRQQPRGGVGERRGRASCFMLGVRCALPLVELLHLAVLCLWP